MSHDILIVDDSLTVRMDLQEAFEAAGLRATSCETLALARQALALGRFDLVLLDVRLPDGDGVDLLQQLKLAPATAQLPVMMLSSEAEVRDRLRGLKTGADEYVGKPYDRSYVVMRARELIGERKGAAPSPPVVLVIDDSATFREQLREALERVGYVVVTAGSGEEGLRTAVRVRPGAVIVDGVMPGIDGATVIRRIRQDAALRRTPCLLLTASEDRRNEVKALEAGADAYVRKEDDLQVILTRLSAMVRSAGGTRPLADASPSFLGPKKILAVDDSPTYLQELAVQLRDENYDVVMATSGEEALELLAVQSVDCILLDLGLPGISGLETCRRIKAHAEWRDIPLLMLTAREDRDAMIEGINAGADDYIGQVERLRDPEGAPACAAAAQAVRGRRPADARGRLRRASCAPPKRARRASWPTRAPTCWPSCSARTASSSRPKPSSRTRTCACKRSIATRPSSSRTCRTSCARR